MPQPAEQNYYLRGVVDALMAVPNTISDDEAKAITDERNRISSAEERGEEIGEGIGVLMFAKSMLDSGINIGEVAKHTDFTPDELERLLQDRNDLIKERMRIRGYASAFEKEWHRQEDEAKEQTIDSRLSIINARIEEFELQYGDTYDNLYGHLSEIEIDSNAEAVDILDWRDLEKEKNRITNDFEDDFPDGVFAIPSSPDEPRIKLRALQNYCKQVGKEPSELTQEELEPFLDRNE
ncbi:hypothetical protein VQ056_23170 [Paenibacillus sp. JTLBN-2024]